MENQNTVVNQENPTPSVTETKTETTQEPASGVTGTVEKSVYEKVREAMKAERAEKRQALSEVEQLRKRIEELESRGDDDDKKPARDPRLDVLYLVQKDQFVKENLDLIEQKMTDNPHLDVNAAVREVKAEMFDLIEKEVAKSTSNQPQKQERPTAVPEPSRYEPSGDAIKDALDGKLNVPPEQLIAIKRVLGK
jgi:hypothetical protein